MHYAYVLLCKSWQSGRTKFYIGSTDNLNVRLKQHREKASKFTKRFDKIDLVYYEACLNKTDARKRELQLKTGFGRGYINRRLASYLKTLRD